MKWMTGALVALLTVGCVGVAIAKTPPTGGWLAGKSLVKGAKVLIVPLADGSEREEGVAAGSGTALTAAIRDYLMSKGLTAIVGDARKLDEAFTQAEKLGCHYVVRAAITEWEDNATAWSGKSDVLGLSFELFEVAAKEPAATCSCRRRSPSFTLASNKPEELIARALSDCPGILFGEKSR